MIKPYITTSRCVLRPASPNDYDALAAALAMPAFPADLPLAILYRQQRLAPWFETMLARVAAADACWLSIDAQASNPNAAGRRCIGQVSLVRLGSSSDWNLAFWLHPDYWGTGLALETVPAAIDFSCAHLAIRRLIAAAADWNVRSIRTLSKLGFQPWPEGLALFGTHINSELQVFARRVD